MALNDDDKKTVLGLVTEALGLPEGKKLSDILGEQINGTVNAYDKRAKKEAEKLTEALKAITEKIAALEEGKGSDGDDGDPGGKAGSGGNAELEKLKADFEKSMKGLQAKLEASEKAREQEKQERERAEGEAADRVRVDTVRQALGKAGITDPDMIELALDHIEHRSLVKLTDDRKGYVFQTGVDQATNDPTFGPLEAALKDWTQKGLGKRFIPAVPGSGGGANNQGRPDGGGGTLTTEQVARMSSAEIEKAVREGRIQTEAAG